MHGVDAEILDRMPIFAGLGREQVGRLIEGATNRRYPAEADVIQRGGRATHLHVVVSGIVELYGERAASEFGFLLLLGGDVFMPAAALFDEPYLCCVRTLGPTRLLAIPAVNLREEFVRSPEFAANVARALAGQFRMAMRHISDLNRRSAPQRLAAFLLRLVDDGPLADQAQLPLQKRHLAARLGMAPETLSRTLQVLAENGVVVRGNQVRVRDRERAERFCGPTTYDERDEQSLGVRAI